MPLTVREKHELAFVEKTKSDAWTILLNSHSNFYEKFYK